MLENGQWQAKMWEKFSHLKKSTDYFVLGKKKKVTNYFFDLGVFSSPGAWAESSRLSSDRQQCSC